MTVKPHYHITTVDRGQGVGKAFTPVLEPMETCSLSLPYPQQTLTTFSIVLQVELLVADEKGI